MAGTVNHATNNEMAKITDTIYFAHDTVTEREERLRRSRDNRGCLLLSLEEESNIVLEETEKLLKIENQGWKKEEHARDIRTP